MIKTISSLSVVLVGSLSFVALGCGREAVRPTSAPSPDLEGRAESEAKAAAPTGERMAELLRGVSYEEGGTTDWRIPLEAGNCYYFGYAADAMTEKMSLYIWNPSGSRLDSMRGKPTQGMFQHCATMSGMYRLQAKAGNSGHYAVVTYKTKSAAPPPPPAAPIEKATDLAALIEQQAASAAPGAKRVGEYFAGSADSSAFYTQMEPGKCYWVIGAGEPKKVKKLYLYLWSPDNKRITENRSESELAMVGHCAKQPGMFKFEAKVESGKGDYKVGVFAK